MKSIKALLPILFLGFQLTLSLTAQDTGASAIPDMIVLTPGADTSTSFSVTWRTDTLQKKQKIQFEQGSETLLMTDQAVTIEAQSESFESDLGPFFTHRARITGLKPDTAYRYRVGDQNAWSSTGVMTTARADKADFDFLIFGDSQSGSNGDADYSAWQTTLTQALSTAPTARFIVQLGDLVEAGGMTEHWNAWFAVSQKILQTLFFVPTIGNHETFNSDGISRLPLEFLSRFTPPAGGPESLIGHAYSFDYGDVHFTVLDSQDYEEAPANGGSILPAQKAWLEKDLAATTKKWKIALFHKPPYYNRADRANEEIKNAFCPLFDQYHVDLVLNGHDHGYSRTYPIFADHFKNKPSQGTIYITVGRSGNKTYRDLAPALWDSFFYDPQDQPNFLTASVRADKLTIAAFLQDGTPIDSYTIDKKTDSDSPLTKLPRSSLSPRLAIYGKICAGTEPLIASDFFHWYIPAQSFAKAAQGHLMVEGKDIKIRMGNYVYRFEIGKTDGFKNEKPIQLSEPPIQNKDQVLLSSTDLDRLFGFKLTYDQTLNIVHLAK